MSGNLAAAPNPEDYVQMDMAELENSIKDWIIKNDLPNWTGVVYSYLVKKFYTELCEKQDLCKKLANVDIKEIIPILIGLIVALLGGPATIVPATMMAVFIARKGLKKFCKCP